MQQGWKEKIQGNMDFNMGMNQQQQGMNLKQQGMMEMQNGNYAQGQRDMMMGQTAADEHG